MKRAAAACFLIVAATSAGFAQTTDAAAQRSAMLERARKAELPGRWTPPPIAAASHYAAAYAQRMCSAVFVAGMDPSVARQTLGDNNALAAVAHRIKAGEPVVDRRRREVRVQAAAGRVRVARQVGSQGCVILAEDGQPLRFAPSNVAPKVAAAQSALWRMGDRLPAQKPGGYDAAKVGAALDAAFAPDDALTQAFVVTWRGHLIGERYGLGASATTPLEGWSMGKSIVASLLGVLIQQGAYTLDQPAPVPEWQSPNDPRRNHPHPRHHADVERPSHQGRAGSGICL
jgi:uncharacterized metal-binding protein